jgi:transposase-like protein
MTDRTPPSILLPIKAGALVTEYTVADKPGGQPCTDGNGMPTKALIILEGLKGKPVAEICTAHQISQSLYYQWRDQFFANAAKAFDDPQRTRKEARLAQENTRLKLLVGEFTFELKKSEERLA